MDMSIAAKTAETELDPKQVRAELVRAAELAMGSPASQAACDIMRLVKHKSRAIKTMPMRTRFQGGGAKNDGWDSWWASWGCNGQSFSMYLSMYGPFTSTQADGTIGARIDGDGFLSLQVDDEQVLALRVELRCDDPEGRIQIVGATEFEPGAWTDVILELNRRLTEAALQTARKAA